MSERLTTVKEVAASMLDQDAGPVVRYHLLRDVLRRPPDDPELMQARQRLGESCCIRELAAEQWANGGWGNFHSRNTRCKQRISTTEAGVERATALGLDRSHPILDKASRYIVDTMNGERPLPDAHEREGRSPITNYSQAGTRRFKPP